MHSSNHGPPPPRGRGRDGSSTTIRRRRRGAAVAAALTAAGLGAAVLVGDPQPAGAAAGSGIPAGTYVESVGAAPYFMGDSDLVVSNAVDDAGGRLYFTHGRGFGSPGWSPDGWREIPGGGRTVAKPAVVRGDLRNYVAVVGTGMDIHYQVAHDEWGGKSWNAGWTPIPGAQKLNTAPALAFHGTTGARLLSAFARGVDGRLYRNTMDVETGVWLPEWLPLNTPTPLPYGHGPTAAVIGGKIFLAVTGEGRRTFVGWYSGSGAAWSEVPGGGVSTAAPALAQVGPNLLAVVVEAEPGHLLYNTATAPAADTAPIWSSSTWTREPGSGLFRISLYGAGPTASTTPDGARMHLYGRGLDSATYVLAVEVVPGSAPRRLRLAEGYPGWQQIPGTVPPPPPGPTTPPPPPPTTTAPPPPARPDLVWTTAPQSIEWDVATRTVSLTLKNQGNAPAGPFYAGFILNYGSVDAVKVESLAVGASQKITFDIPLVQPGVWPYNFVVDQHSAVTESNERNNSIIGSQIF
jgi:hypothetical protein